MSRNWLIALQSLLGVALASFAVIASQYHVATDSPYRVSMAKRHQKIATSSRLQYEIVLGGTADMDNTLTRTHTNFEIGFQPNVSLEIANVGDVTVENPRVVTGDRRRWWSLDAMLDEILTGDESNQERVLAIWDFVRRNRYHDTPPFENDELHDPVKFLCTYGSGLCDDSGNVGCALLQRAGERTGSGSPEQRYAIIRALHGHVMCEARVDDRFAFLDIDQEAFYLDRENERLVSGDAIVRDHDLASREHAYGPIFAGWDSGRRAAALFGRDDEKSFRAITGHEIRFSLRPGEAIDYRWDQCGKYVGDRHEPPHFFGNSRLRYTPRLDAGQYKTGLFASRGIAPSTARNSDGDSSVAALAGVDENAFLTYEITSPFAIGGGRFRAQFAGSERDDSFGVDVSTDGENWQPMWQEGGQGTTSCHIDLDQQLHSAASYRYFIRVRLASSKAESARVYGIEFETDVMTSPHFLPRLSLGRNQVEYTDDTREPHRVRLTYVWQESDNVHPPAAPAMPIFPGPDAVVRASTIDFRWFEIQGAQRYHIQVSRYPDMRLPYRPSFDLAVDTPRHGSPFTGLFSPNTTYYWRVRAQNGAGMWGPWSETWRFTWDGPRVPVNVVHDIDASGGITIRWQPNPRGPAPVRYEVYGSDERGFSVGGPTTDDPELGGQPARLLTTTNRHEQKVVGPELTQPGANRCFYRVVAIDEHGTRSGPSDYVELPHPYLFSAPPEVAHVGQPYRHQIRTLRSIGDLQQRYMPQPRAYWERESYEFALLHAPEWLNIDSATGLVSGTPQKADVGVADVEVVARRRYDHEVGPDGKEGAVFQKVGAEFEAIDNQRLAIRVVPR